jgi:hypothetical protein
MRHACKILVVKFAGKRRLERFRLGWEEYIKINLQ